jgi:putative transposase
MVLSHLGQAKHKYLLLKNKYSKAIILQVGFFLKLRFSLSCQDVEELLSIRGVKVDHATNQRWLFKFTSLVEQQFRKRTKSVGKKMENGGDLH